jgi:hypothetical protein
MVQQESVQAVRDASPHNLSTVYLREHERPPYLEGLSDVEFPKGLSDETRAAVHAVLMWKHLMTTAGGVRNRVRDQMHERGYLPDRATMAHALQGNGFVPSAAQHVLQALLEKRMRPEEIVAADPAEFARQTNLPLSRSRVAVLQSIMRHELQLYAEDLADLARRFPYPITRGNFFGKFIAGSGQSPERAARHLQLAMPFFIRMQTVIEGLRNDKRNFLVIGRKAESTDEKGEKKIEWESLSERERELVEACIRHAPDFEDPHRAERETPDFALIDIPELLTIEEDEDDDDEERGTKKRWRKSTNS